jgi:hypothetical protein
MPFAVRGDECMAMMVVFLAQKKVETDKSRFPLR